MHQLGDLHKLVGDLRQLCEKVTGDSSTVAKPNPATAAVQVAV